jgi:hypothetical protein
MVSGILPVGITQNEHFLSCDTFLLGLRYIYTELSSNREHKVPQNRIRAVPVKTKKLAVGIFSGIARFSTLPGRIITMDALKKI